METGGLDPRKNPLSSIGAVEFENPKNTFYTELSASPDLKCDARALQVNGINIGTWNYNAENFYTGMKRFHRWCMPIKEQTLAGHNPSFDRDFCNMNLEKVGVYHYFNHRTIDLHTVAHVIFTQKGLKFDKLYSDAIYRLLEIPTETKQHNVFNPL